VRSTRALARAAWIGLLTTLAVPGPAHGQTAATPSAQPTPAPAPEAADAKRPRPGRYQLGPVYLTPKFRIGALGLDTNVFYTPTDRRTDFTGSGGPGLEVVLPLTDTAQLVVNGTLDYLHYLRTAALRRLNGAADGRLELNGARTSASIGESYGKTYARPNYEVDQRIPLSTEATRAKARRRLFGRISADLAAERSHTEVPPGQTFLGNDLQRTLTYDRYGGRGTLEYAITVKTSFLVEVSRERTLFPLASDRDGDIDQLRAGIQTMSTALISGKVLVGRGRFRSRTLRVPDRGFASFDVDATLHVSPRTRLGGSYGRGLQYSAFDSPGRPPTLRTEVIGATIEKEIVGQRVLMRMHGTLSRFQTDEAIAVQLPDAQVTNARSDRVKTGNVDLEYRFRPRFRVGVTGGYFGRHSNFSYFGVHGLLVGATASLSP
jgi:hypothetical protein